MTEEEYQLPNTYEACWFVGNPIMAPKPPGSSFFLGIVGPVAFSSLERESELSLWSRVASLQTREIAQHTHRQR